MSNTGGGTGAEHDMSAESSSRKFRDTMTSVTTDNFLVASDSLQANDLDITFGSLTEAPCRNDVCCGPRARSGGGG